MDASSLPAWAQSAATIAIAIVAAIIGVFRYLKTQAKAAVAEPTTGAVLSASFIDSKLLRELIEALREHQEETGRDAKRALRASQDLRESVQENTEAVIVQTDTTTNLLKFISRETPRPPRVALSEPTKTG